MNNQSFKIHVFYIISILIGIIIILISVKWGKIDKLVEYITFALTLTSLVLALLAIIYAVFSNSKFVQNITTLTNISDEVKNSSKELSQATEELKSKIDVIPSSIKDVQSKASETHELLMEMSKKSEKSASNDEMNNKLKSEETITKKELLTSLLDYSSFNGKLIMYASFLSLEKKESFSLDELFQDSKDYMLGFFISLASVGIIKYTKKDNIVTVLYLSELIKEKISDIIIESAESYDKKNEKTVEDEYSWVRQVNEVTKYFEN